jgi:hypothetical protein
VQIFVLNMIIGGSSASNVVKAGLALSFCVVYLVLTFVLQPFLDRSRAVAMNLVNVGRTVQTTLVVTMVSSSSIQVETGFVVVTVFVIASYLVFFVWKLFTKLSEVCCKKAPKQNKIIVVSTPSDPEVMELPNHANLVITPSSDSIVERPSLPNANNSDPVF